MNENQLKRANDIKDEISLFEKFKTDIVGCDTIDFIGGDSSNRWVNRCYKKDNNLYHSSDTSIVFNHFQRALIMAIDEEIQRLNEEFEKL